MSKRPRRNHAPAFKAKVALEAFKCEQTIVELSQLYLLSPKPDYKVEETTYGKCGRYFRSR